MRRQLGLVILIVAGAGAPAHAQQVQQPVVGVAGVNTTVSVPDRGRMMLGGVSRAASARTTFGPIPSGASAGFATSGSSTDARVWIQNLDVLDEQMLHQMEGRVAGLSEGQRRDLAQEIMQSRRGSSVAAGSIPRSGHWDRTRALQILKGRR